MNLKVIDPHMDASLRREEESAALPDHKNCHLIKIEKAKRLPAKPR
jgi:hypothetical protein